jgi:hypothetical protein
MALALSASAAGDWTSSAPLTSPFDPAAAIQEPPDAPPPPAPVRRARFGTAGTWRINVMGGAGLALSGDDELARGTIGFSRFIIDDLAWELEFGGLFFRQEDGHDAFAGNASLLIRYHVLSDVNWSAFLEAGAGLLAATAEVPPGGTNLNFTPQAGGGVSIELQDDVRLLVGIRWHHVSNASLSSGNPGLDSWLAYAGLSVPF